MLEPLSASPAAFVAAAAVVGLVVGSFLNVVIYRLPIVLERQWRADSTTDSAHEPFNLVVPRSRCPACQAPIRSIHNIPLLSYLWLRGRCAACRAPISARYPAVELLCAIATGVAAWRFGYGAAAACAIVVTWFLIALTFIDLDTQLLPDSLTLPLLWLGLLASLSGWGASAQGLPSTPSSAIAGAAIGYLVLWTIYHLFRVLTGKQGMGYGDFKLLAALGAWLGWQMLLPIVLVSALAGAVVGIGLILARRQQRGAPMPFGPFLAAAGWLVMLWGPQMVAGYLGLFRPYSE
ncbi:MAG TPA: A24 family peptidase [Steroidobacteraceae bacterium]